MTYRKTSNEYIKEHCEIMIRQTVVIVCLALAGAAEAQTPDGIVADLKNPAKAQEVEQLLKSNVVAGAIAGIRNALASDPAFQAEAPRVSAYRAIATAGRTEGSGVIRDEVVITQLLSGLREDSATVRFAAATSLSKIGASHRVQAATELQRTLRDHSSAVRQSAIRTLTEYGPDAAVALLDLRMIVERPAKSEAGTSGQDRGVSQTRPTRNLPSTTSSDPDLVDRTLAAAARIAIGSTVSDVKWYSQLDPIGIEAARWALVNQMNRVVELIGSTEPSLGTSVVAFGSPGITVASYPQDVRSGLTVLMGRLSTTTAIPDDVREAARTALEAACKTGDDGIKKLAASYLVAPK